MTDAADRERSADRDRGLTPARGTRDRREPTGRSAAPEPPARDSVDPAAEVLDLERGRTAALIAALGRLQLTVEILSKNQARAEAEMRDALARIESRLSGLRPPG